MFLCIFLFTRNRDCQWKWSPKWTQSWLCWELFSEKERKSKSAFRLHRRIRIACEPTPWSAQGDIKKHNYSRNLFVQRKTWNLRKMTPKRSPNGWVYFGLTSLWRPLGHHWCPSPFWSTKNEPKVLPKCPRKLNITPKSNPKDLESSKRDFKSASTFETWPGGLREALYNKRMRKSGEWGCAN